MNLYRMYVTDETHLRQHGTIRQRRYYVLADDMLDAIQKTPRPGLEPIDWVSGERLPGDVFVGTLGEYKHGH